MANKQEEKEVCITHEEYMKLIELQEETKAGISELKFGQEAIQKDVSLIKPMVTGNGHPEEGLSFRTSALEIWREKVDTFIDTYIAEQKKLTDTRKNRHWQVAAPFISELIRWVIFGGGIYFLLQATTGG